MTTLHIAKPPLFSFEEAMRYTTRGFDDPRYVVGERSVSTAIASGSACTAGGAGERGAGAARRTRFEARSHQYSDVRLVALLSLFEALAWCVIGQQINLAFAYTLKRRLSERYARWVEIEGRRYYLFPDPATLAEADREELRSIQLSYHKAGYLTGSQRHTRGSFPPAESPRVRSSRTSLRCFPGGRAMPPSICGARF